METFILISFLLIMLPMVFFYIYGKWRDMRTRRQERNNMDERIEYLRNRYGEITYHVSLSTYPNTFFVFGQTRYIVVGHYACNFDSILDVYLNGRSVSSENFSFPGAIRGAIIGDAFFGELGAIIGYHKGGTTTTVEDEYTVVFVIDDPSTPTIEFRTDDLEDAKRVLSISRECLNLKHIR